MIESGTFRSKSWMVVRRESSKVKEKNFSKAVLSNENPPCDEMRGESFLSEGKESMVAPVKDATVDAILKTVVSNDAKCQIMKRDKASVGVKRM